MTLVLVIKQDTFLKDQPVQSSTLQDNQKQNVKAGGAYEIKSFEEVKEDHLKVILPSGKVVYIFQLHAQVKQDNKVVFPKASSVKLNMPQYWDQHENALYPGGSCNLTSVAHCLAYLGIKGKGGRLPDELLQYADDHNLSRHSPHDMDKIAEAYGFKNDFSSTATLEQVKAHLDKGFPCIVHGYFTTSGHIITLVGYNDQGFWSFDSWGECLEPGHYDENTWSNNQKGRYVHYTYDLIKKTCIDQEFWVHFIYR